MKTASGKGSNHVDCRPAECALQFICSRGDRERGRHRRDHVRDPDRAAEGAGGFLLRCQRTDNRELPREIRGRTGLEWVWLVGCKRLQLLKLAIRWQGFPMQTSGTPFRHLSSPSSTSAPSCIRRCLSSRAIELGASVWRFSTLSSAPSMTHPVGVWASRSAPSSLRRPPGAASRRRTSRRAPQYPGKPRVGRIGRHHRANAVVQAPRAPRQPVSFVANHLGGRRGEVIASTHVRRGRWVRCIGVPDVTEN